jgi:hypothetical protein
MNTKVIAVTAIAVILMGALIMGCVEKAAPISTSEFRNITADALDDIGYQLEDVAAAEARGDYATAKTELAAFDISLKQYITEFEKMAVAENAIPCKKAVIRVFKETQILGECLDDYLETPSIDTYTRYTAQARKVLTQTEIATMLAKNI